MLWNHEQCVNYSHNHGKTFAVVIAMKIEYLSWSPSLFCLCLTPFIPKQTILHELNLIHIYIFASSCLLIPYLPFPSLQVCPKICDKSLFIIKHLLPDKDWRFWLEKPLVNSLMIELFCWWLTRNVNTHLHFHINRSIRSQTGSRLQAPIDHSSNQLMGRPPIQSIPWFFFAFNLFTTIIIIIKLMICWCTRYLFVWCICSKQSK